MIFYVRFPDYSSSLNIMLTYSLNKYMNNIILLRKWRQDKTFTIYIHI